MPRILIVDDHEPTRRVMARLLARPGREIVTAGTVAEALAALDPAPRCAILDVVLPDGDARRIAEEIAARGLATRLVVCTGASDPGHLAAAEAIAPGRVFIKPIAAADLLFVVG